MYLGNNLGSTESPLEKELWNQENLLQKSMWFSSEAQCSLSSFSVLSSVLDELNEKVQFSSKVRFLVNFELNLVHFSKKELELN